MPSLSGVLDADFSRFVGEAKKADAALVGMQTAAGKVEGSLSHMADNVEPIQRVSKSVKDLGESNDDAAKKTGGLVQQFRQFDDVLDASGVNILNEVKAVEQLSDAFKSGGGNLSTFSKAGLVAGAAMAGWAIGKKIDEWTGLSKAIGDATAELLGWNTASGGAGSGADTLARASAIAGREVRSLDDALRIIRAEIEKNQAAWRQATGPAEAAKLVKQYRDEIEGLRKSGALPQLKADIEAGIIPQKELSRLYGVSAEALGILGDQVSAHKKRVEDINKENEKFVALQDRLFGRELIAKAQEYARALDGIGNVSKLLPSEMENMNKVFQAAVEQLGRLGLAGSGVQKMFADLAVATTNWADVNEKVGKLDDGLTAVFNKRREAYRAQLVDQMNLNQGVNEGAEYWRHAGEIADKAMADAAAAANETTQAVVAQKTQVDALAGSFAILSRTAAEWRATAAQLEQDAARNEMSGGGGTFFSNWQIAQDQRAQAQRARERAGRQDQLDAAIAGSSAPWGRGGNAYSINVNAMQGINGDQVAAELIAGMRRRGVALG